MTNYQTKITGIIATDDLPIYLETAFTEDYLNDDNLESFLDALENKAVVNYNADFEAEDYIEVVEKLIANLPNDHYFIAIETPVYHFFSNGKIPCYSWGYTQTTWVFVDSLKDIDKYRQIVGKMADETLVQSKDEIGESKEQ